MLIKDFVKQVLNSKQKQVNGCFIIIKHNQVFEQYWYENNKLLYDIPDEIMNKSIDYDVYSYATEDWINFDLYI